MTISEDGPSITVIRNTTGIAKRHRKCATCKGQMPAGTYFRTTIALEDGVFVAETRCETPDWECPLRTPAQGGNEP